MAYQIEARPQLIDPDCWDGIDIFNAREVFLGYMDTDLSRGQLINSDGILSGKERRQISEALAQGLGQSLVGAAEATTFNQEIFIPSERQLPDGSLITLEEERLSKLWTPHGQSKSYSGKKPRVVISRPHINYWAEATNAGHVALDQEKAHFPENLQYMREVKFGVIKTDEKEGKRKLYAIPLNEVYPSEGNITLEKRGGGRRILDLPIVLGKVSVNRR